MGFFDETELRINLRLLRKIAREIDAYFKVSYMGKEVRSTDIYDFIKNRKPLSGEFLSGREFNRFLRQMHDTGIMKAVVPNYTVDTSNPRFYQWKFYRRERMEPTEIKAESTIKQTHYFKHQRNIPTNNGDMVQSAQEQYIYNRLLNESGVHVQYEMPINVAGAKKIPDFTVINLANKKVYRWEHLGMAKNPSYALETNEKLQWYFENGYRYIEDGGTLIFTYFGNEHEFQNDVERIIELIRNTE